MQRAYDFDKTIYDGDSTQHFYFYLLKHKPSILKYLPYQAFWFVFFILGVISKTQFKEKFYRCFRCIKDIDKYVLDFWKEKKSGIKKFYLNQKSSDDIIISASPEFLLKPICDELGIELIASRVDKKTGAYTGENCYGEEKVKRFKEVYGDKHIDEFYSDSLSDTPMAEIADKAYVVIKEELVDWKEYKPSGIKKLIKIFTAKEFFRFLLIGGFTTISGIVFSMLYSIRLNVNFAYVCGYITSLFLAYILNSIFNFKEGLSIKKCIKFFISYIPNFIVLNSFVYVFYNLLHWYKLFAFISASIIGIPVTFLLMRFFTFNKVGNGLDRSIKT